MTLAAHARAVRTCASRSCSRNRAPARVRVCEHYEGSARDAKLWTNLKGHPKPAHAILQATSLQFASPRKLSLSGSQA